MAPMQRCVCTSEGCYYCLLNVNSHAEILSLEVLICVFVVCISYVPRNFYFLQIMTRFPVSHFWILKWKLGIVETNHRNKFFIIKKTVYPWGDIDKRCWEWRWNPSVSSIPGWAAHTLRHCLNKGSDRRVEGRKVGRLGAKERKKKGTEEWKCKIYDKRFTYAHIWNISGYVSIE